MLCSSGAISLKTPCWHKRALLLNAVLLTESKKWLVVRLHIFLDYTAAYLPGPVLHMMLAVSNMNSHSYRPAKCEIKINTRRVFQVFCV